MSRLWDRVLPLARWLTIHKLYFHRGQSYIALVDTFTMMFLLWGVWMDKLPFEVTYPIAIIFVVLYTTGVVSVGKFDYIKGVAKFEAEFNTRELNPFYLKLEQDIQIIKEHLEAQAEQKA